MVRWFSPPRLVSIGIRAAVSTVFGEFADRRDAMAAERQLNPINFDSAHDYRSQGETDFWFDFAADTGDGWDSTYAVARLLAEPQLILGENPLPRARILVLGGDQVYPTPSEQDYVKRFVTPFNEAYSQHRWSPDSAPDLYAIPGNHDWYDGLSAFLNLFCWRQIAGPWSAPRRGKMIGGRKTQQLRSYFALALPHDWWVWGLDIQLTNYIDQQQINFFDHVARTWMAPGSRLILCTGEPDWSYVDTTSPEKKFSHFSYVESLVGHAAQNHRLCLVLTGDSHHYSRYTEADRHYITAGGAGAFLHPTHHLADKAFAWEWPQPGAPAPAPIPPGQPHTPRFRRAFSLARDPNTQEPRLFPDRKTSRCLAWRNLGFAFYNWDYALTLGVACAIFAWLLHTNARIENTSLPGVLIQADGLLAALCAYVRLVFVSPWPLLMLSVAAGGYYYFADYKPPWRAVAGIVHTAAQLGVVVLVTVLCARSAPGGNTTIGLIAYVGIVGGICAATIMGLYLLVSLNGFGVHSNEGFSSLRIGDFRSFLRFQIKPDGALVVYPIGLKDVPSDHGDTLRNPPLKPHLIEPPITVS